MTSKLSEILLIPSHSIGSKIKFGSVLELKYIEGFPDIGCKLFSCLALGDIIE